jgi:hypothetical protein
VRASSIQASLPCFLHIKQPGLQPFLYRFIDIVVAQQFQAYLRGPNAAAPAAAVLPAGTSERVLLLSGTLHSVLTSVFLMLEKLPKEPVMAMGRAAGKPREDAVSSKPTAKSQPFSNPASTSWMLMLATVA